ncbi:MAG: HAMP domain-containing sensor histidine kinase [Bacteroidota bacterium]
MDKLRQHNHWLLFAMFLLIGGVFIFFLNENFKQKELEARQIRLEYHHNRTLAEFANSIDKFAGLVAGMRSYVNLSSELPTAAEFQQFVKNQFDDIKSKDPVVVSLIDTSHVFLQSFTRDEMNPAGLVGRSVSSLRSERKIKMLDQLMQQDSLQMFPPINLVEGWIGLPINFRVERDGTTLGYVAAIINFKSIMDDIYMDNEVNDLIFHFSTEEGYDFDRERTYNNTKVYNVKEDSEYYKNFTTDTSEFVYSNATFYGFNVRIGSAFKNPAMVNTGLSSVLLLWYLTFAFLAFIVTFQAHRSKKLNARLVKTNVILEGRRKEIKNQNRELKNLSKTQNKFFSIIGHDLKQPLNAVEGLLHLLEHEDIKDPDLMVIIDRLKESTGNTVDLLNNLLRWAMSQTGDIQYKEGKINLNELLFSITQASIHQADEKDISLTFTMEERIFYHGDRDMLETIVRNLVSNAIKFTDSKGEIKVSASSKDGFLSIKVTDNGVGMNPEELKSLFVVGEQISTEGTAGETGTGLGLILCQDFARHHGGNVEVSSQPKVGTEFTVLLPMKENDSSFGVPAPPAFMKIKSLEK